MILLLILLIVIGAAAYYFLPHPAGQFVAFLCGAVVTVLLILLLFAVLGDAGAGDVRVGDGH